jgi:hypothetical protein
LATFICATGGCTHPGDVIDTWEARSERVTIRVRKFDEKPKYILSQYYFSFDVQDRRSHEWRSVLMWMVDDPIPIQREQVKFVNDAIVYAFGNARFVVTTDAGRTWSEWDAKKAVPKPQAYMIDRVLVSDDGTGRMIVRRSTNENNGLAELATTDFGVHWTLEDERR